MPRGFLPHTGCRQSNPGSARIQQKAPVRQLTAEGYTMKSYDLVLYRELRADGFAAIAALFYARKAKRGY